MWACFYFQFGVFMCFPISVSLKKTLKIWEVLAHCELRTISMLPQYHGKFKFSILNNYFILKFSFWRNKIFQNISKYSLFLFHQLLFLWKGFFWKKIKNSEFNIIMSNLPQYFGSSCLFESFPCVYNIQCKYAPTLELCKAGMKYHKSCCTLKEGDTMTFCRNIGFQFNCWVVSGLNTQHHVL